MQFLPGHVQKRAMLRKRMKKKRAATETSAVHDGHPPLAPIRPL